MDTSVKRKNWPILLLTIVNTGYNYHVNSMKPWYNLFLVKLTPSNLFVYIHLIKAIITSVNIMTFINVIGNN